MTKAELDSWTRNTSKDICDWFDAQPPKFERMLEYSTNDVDVTASAIDEVRKIWTTNMSTIVYGIQGALWSYGRVSSIELKTCWNEPIIEAKVDISRWFDIDDIHHRLSKLPWARRVVHIDFDAITRSMEIAIEFNETIFNQERTVDMPPKEDYSGYFAALSEKLGTRPIIADTMAIFFNDPSIQIKKVAFNGPATIVFWADGTKTIVKCMEGEEFDPEKGLAMAICKRLYGGKFHRVFKDAIKNAKW